jgi:hypothetical protein
LYQTGGLTETGSTSQIAVASSTQTFHTPAAKVSGRKAQLDDGIDNNLLADSTLVLIGRNGCPVASDVVAGTAGVECRLSAR